MRHWLINLVNSGEISPQVSVGRTPSCILSSGTTQPEQSAFSEHRLALRALDRKQCASDCGPVGGKRMAILNTVLVSNIDEAIEGDVAAQILLSFDVPPTNLTTIRITPNASDVDVGSGAGVSRVVIVGAGKTTITATAVDDALVEGDETGLPSFELGGTLDPLFTLDPVPDLALRLVDDDVNNPAEVPYTLLTEGFETDGNGVRYTASIPEFSDGSTDFFVRTNGANISSAYEVSGEVGSFFFAGQDIDAASVAGGGGPTAICLRPVHQIVQICTLGPAGSSTR